MYNLNFALIPITVMILLILVQYRSLHNTSYSSHSESLLTISSEEVQTPAPVCQSKNESK
ncbi:hypothetical protein Taro_053404 [Colocasia esculenta]|uniref:Uncharacterized protein n=1 Tax=Colocasia esculenta TaxID=4460 RepID=A0A843XMY6_COLES|nr:hypothetical protein [Colocasia esculenta]